MNETHSILQRMKELATEAANGTLNSQDRKHIQEEINQLTSEINNIGNNTEFNTIKLLDSSVYKYDGVNSEIKLQIGANAGQSFSKWSASIPSKQPKHPTRVTVTWEK